MDKNKDSDQHSELRLTQQELSISRDQYFELYDLAPVGYFTISEKGLIQKINLTGANLIGISKSNFLNKPFNHFIFSEDQDEYYFLSRQAFQTRTSQNSEIRMVKGDGSIFYVSLSCIVANNLDGIDVFRITITDITNRKMAEKELQKYKDHLEELVKTRTNELSIANENLQKEIIEHKKSKEELNIYTEQLKIFNDAMVNREIRIIELKIQINSLCEELGREPIYPPIWG